MKLLLFAASLLLFCEPLRASGGALPAAKERAVLYQAEVRAALLKHTWHITAEAPGIIVADHMLLYQSASANEPNGPTGYTRAVIKFKAASMTDTECKASVLDYKAGYYLAADVEKYHGRVPLPSDPRTVKMMEKIIADARSQLFEKHPEYAPLRAR